MNFILDFEFSSIAVTYHIKKISEIEFINYFIENSVNKNIYIVIKYLFECQ